MNNEYLSKQQKGPLSGVLGKRYSENMQQIYKRTPIPKCDFNKVAAINFNKFAAYSQNPFSQEQEEWLLLK